MCALWSFGMAELDSECSWSRSLNEAYILFWEFAPFTKISQDTGHLLLKAQSMDGNNLPSCIYNALLPARLYNSVKQHQVDFKGAETHSLTSVSRNQWHAKVSLNKSFQNKCCVFLSLEALKVCLL